MQIEEQEQPTQLEPEDNEQEILLSPEMFGEIGDGTLTIQKNGTDIGTFSANQNDDTTINIEVPTAVSDLTNDLNYQTENNVTTAISTHNQSTSAHQDIRQAITDEQTARVNADNSLQGQIDAITSASDVVDIVGTYAELQAYDTQHLKDNDVVKVLQDETHNDAMTYWRWSTHTQTWTYIGAEGPYYTKSETNTLLDAKLDADEVPDGFFDGPATITPADGITVEVDGGLKLKAINLKGDTTQQTYSGKNLIQPIADGTHTNAGITWTVSGDSIVGSGTASSSPSNITDSNMYFVTPLPAGTYTFSLQEPAPRRTTIFLMDSGGTGHNAGYVEANETSVTFTTNYTSVYYRIAAGQLTTGTQYNITYINKFQLEAGSTATAFEPYVGGIPAPNPDYPQTVNVVTGTQTITLSDGEVSDDYTVTLGSMELVKIGDYQDYIYKRGDDWYVHKETGKVVFTGTEDWTLAATYTNNKRFVCNDIITSSASNTVLSDYFTQGEGGSDTENVAINNSNRKIMLTISNSTVSNLADFKTWLGSNKPTVYYILATSTDTQITDSTLIGQLNAVLNATIYQPTTIISSSGNLPAILGIVAYTEHLNSLLEIAAEPIPEPVTYSDFVGTDGVNAGTAGLVPAPAATDNDKYLKSDGTWATVSGGGSVTPVQTTGTSQTDVMSQNAVSSMVFADPGTDTRIQIGSGANGNWTDSIAIGSSSTIYATNATVIGTSASARGNGVAVGKNAKAGTSSAHTNTVAIGYNAQASAVGAVALGRDSNATVRGEMNIGTSNTGWGYNASNYRLISGVYDGQNAHDVATVGQINATIDAINTALGTSIPHIGA